jgi:TRAP transporter 4TM/12TM fusion protein
MKNLIMQNDIPKNLFDFLSDLLGEKKAAKTFLQAYMQFFGLVICAIIVVTIVVIALVFPKSIPGYTTVLILVLLANFLLKPRLTAIKNLPPSVPLNKKDVWISYCLIAATVLVGIHLLNLFQTLGQSEWVDKIVYWVAIVIILEGVRRVESRTLVFFFMTWGFIIFYFVALDDTYIFFDRDESIFSTKGVYGEALAAVVDVVYAFIFLSFAFHLIHLNKLLNYLAFKITHGRRSGASSAKYAIWASTFYGAMSGGPQDNVKETGEKTIPIMEQAGYPAEFSAGVVATAANVGQLVPPIMGIVAFIIVEISDFSYLEVMLAAIVPAFLFIFSLMVAVILEARVLNLKPLNLQYTTEQMKSQDSQIDKQIWHQLISLVIGFLVLFAMLIMEVSLAGCALSATLVVLVLAYLLPSLRPNKRQLLGFIINSGKNGLNIAISCAAIGIILFVFKQTFAEQQVTEFFISLYNSQQWFWFWKLIVLLVFATLPIVLGMLLPILAVFLIMVFMTVPVLKEIGVPELHAYLFIFYYCVLVSITPPYVPFLDKAAKRYQINNKKRLYRTTFRLSLVAFILPLAWIYNPEMIFDITQFSLFSVTQTIYVALAFMLAIVAVSAAYFGFFRDSENSLSRPERWGLFLSGVLIVLPNFIFMIIGVIMTAYILIQNDLRVPKNSLLRPAFHLVRLIITPPSKIFLFVWLSLISLTLVYTAFFTTNGLALGLSEKSVKPWLKDRFHFTLNVEDCHVKTDKLEEFLQKEGYASTVICSPFAELSVSKISPGEVRLQTKVNAVEFDKGYFQLVPQIKTSLHENYEQEVQSELGSCLEKTGERLKEQKFNPNHLKSTECSYEERALPLVYIGSQLAELLDVSAGGTLHLHDAVFADSLAEDMQANPDRYFVVACIFNTPFADLNRLLIAPTGSLSKLFNGEEWAIEHKLIVKIDNLKNLNDLEKLKAILKQLASEKYSRKLRESLPYDMDHSILDHEIWKLQEVFLNVIQAIYIAIFVICIFVLLSGMDQLLESNRRLLTLMRVSGLHTGAMWVFLFVLSIMGAVISLILAIPLSFVMSWGLGWVFEDISYAMDLSNFLTVFGITLLVAILTTLILGQRYLSRDISNELDYVGSNP